MSDGSKLRERSEKALAERKHQCGCGFLATRDQAAALSMLADGLKLLGREPAWDAKPEPSLQSFIEPTWHEGARIPHR